ncbi:MAG: STAS domain-containing protein [Bacillaceae bacterium]|nr:STAS domain-containing protein [Bacillaceae bacterium]
MNLQVSNTKIGKQNIIKLVGEIDVYTASKLKDELLPITERSGEQLMVDLSAVSYIDSTGLGVFIGALKASYKHGCSLKLIGANDRISRLFAITGLDEIIDIEESAREEAK